MDHSKDKTLAILLLVHKNCDQVKRLVLKLQNNDVDIYIHCDKRWEDGYMELLSLASESVFIIDHRFETNLDTWQLIEAPMEMIRYTKIINRKYKYYSLLSGQDYLLHPIEEIVNNLQKLYPKPIIDCTPYDKRNWIYHKFSSYRYFANIDSKINSRMKRGVLRKIVKFPFYFMEKIISIFKNPYKDLKKYNIDLYGGSAWWILPLDIINFAYNEYMKKSKYIKILSKTYTPEETFFQIMAKLSPLSYLVQCNPKDMVLQNCKTYAYFFNDKKPFKGHPYEFTVADIDVLNECRNNFYFARKFDSTIDYKVLDYIDDNFMV